MKVKQVVLASRPDGIPKASNFRIEDKTLGALKEGEVLVKSMFISVDPYMRGMMNDSGSYRASFQLNQPISGSVVAKVIETRSQEFKKGDTVKGDMPWKTYNIVDAKKISAVNTEIAPAEHYLGILGMTGLTAYFGMMDILKPKTGETAIISGAAGAVGLVAGQLAKINGCRVIGIAGNDAKCRMLREELAFDGAINYRSSADIATAVKSACPSGVDVYYDNVGGTISRGVIGNLNNNARIAVCGQISTYNGTGAEMVPDILPLVLGRHLMIRGFTVRDYPERFNEGIKYLSGKLNSGQLKNKETILKGFDRLPEAFIGLFTGINTGKLIVEAER